MQNQYLEVGKVTNVHGLMGEVKVQPWADSPEFLCQFKTLAVYVCTDTDYHFRTSQFD